MVCTRVAILAHGEIKAIGPIDDLAHHDQQQLIVDVPLADNEQTLDLRVLFGEKDDVTIETGRNGGVHRICMEIVDQTQIDWVIDSLRASNRSIARLEVRRESLEETFMRLVGDVEAGQ